MVWTTVHFGVLFNSFDRVLGFLHLPIVYYVESDGASFLTQQASIGRGRPIYRRLCPYGFNIETNEDKSLFAAHVTPIILMLDEIERFSRAYMIACATQKLALALAAQEIFGFRSHSTGAICVVSVKRCINRKDSPWKMTLQLLLPTLYVAAFLRTSKQRLLPRLRKQLMLMA